MSLELLAVSSMMNAANTGDFSTVSPVLGMAQKTFGAIKDKNDKKPDLYSQGQLGLLNEMKNKRKTTETGADTEWISDDIKEQGAAIAQGMTRASGGNSGQLMSGMANLGKGMGEAYNSVLGASDKRNQFFTGMYDDLMNRMEKRAFEINAYEWGSQLAQAAQLDKAGESNMMAGMAGAMGSGETEALGDAAGEMDFFGDILSKIGKKKAGASDISEERMAGYSLPTEWQQ